MAETAAEDSTAESSCTGELPTATGTSESREPEAGLSALESTDASTVFELASVPLSEPSGTASSMKRVRGGMAFTKVSELRDIPDGPVR